VRESLPGSSILYFYTHGFSVPLSVLRDAANREADSAHWDFNPLVAGVALAGANHGMFAEDSSDGILWASEIATLNLESTEIVTLVACETALGDLIPGEGMQGCQRALIVAGAHTSLASIWSVLAGPAAELTNRFYENVLTRRLSRAESLRHGMRYMLREFDWSNGRKLNNVHRSPPVLWSSWVLSGDWR
jgi:CHAT domain-containing protein